MIWSFVAAGVVFLLIALKFFSQKKPERQPGFDNSTRTVKSKSGKKVEVYNDWPDEMADVISECFESGEIVSGKIEDGKVIRD